MEFVRGMIVRATAGRDQGGFFTVLSVEGDYAMICNGKRRPLEQPKKRNSNIWPPHIQWFRSSRWKPIVKFAERWQLFKNRLPVQISTRRYLFCRNRM